MTASDVTEMLRGLGVRVHTPRLFMEEDVNSLCVQVSGVEFPPEAPRLQRVWVSPDYLPSPWKLEI